jgi:hypothetical protein
MKFGTRAAEVCFVYFMKHGVHAVEVFFLWLKFGVQGMELCLPEFGVHAVEVFSVVHNVWCSCCGSVFYS